MGSVLRVQGAVGLGRRLDAKDAKKGQEQKRKLSPREAEVDEERRRRGPYFPKIDEYWVHECRPADLSGLPKDSPVFSRSKPFELPLGHDHPHSKRPDHDHPYLAGMRNVFDLEHVLNAIHKPACPKDHWLVLADHHEDPLPDCPCDEFPDAHGDINYFNTHHGETMCMKIEVHKKPRSRDELNLVCHEPHADYPHVGVEDGGHRTWLGCRSDQIACKFRGLRLDGWFETAIERRK